MKMQPTIRALIALFLALQCAACAPTVSGSKGDIYYVPPSTGTPVYVPNPLD